MPDLTDTAREDYHGKGHGESPHMLVLPLCITENSALVYTRLGPSVKRPRARNASLYTYHDVGKNSLLLPRVVSLPQTDWFGPTRLSIPSSLGKFSVSIAQSCAHGALICIVENDSISKSTRASSI